MSNGNEAQEIVEEAIVAPVAAPRPLEVELDSQKAIARISAIAHVIEGCAKVSIQRTNPKDWVKMGDSFYLQATGAQKIRPIWGIYYRNRQVTKENNPDGSYSYIVTGEVGSKVLDQLYGEVTIEIDGGRSSTDKFFAKGDREPDPMDIRKAALANWEARAVTAVIGLKNMTAADLAKNGIGVEGITKVEYEKGATGGGHPEFISIPQRKRLFAILKKNGGTEAQLKNHLFVTYALDSSEKIKRGDMYEAICAWAESGGSRKPSNGNGAEPREGE